MHGRNYVSALGNLTPFTSFWEEIVIIMFMISSVPIFYLNYLISIKSLKCLENSMENMHTDVRV